ncbi:hypothetical protein Moror_12041 [Moniliophthora roreri MCA 2997]|uniref:DDE-1 domain-containing protein n=1 Tax=Moniliophthora roreri (strain MCA 2997) TaxID=1381753 RepID=V2XW63_MONRO|nr:hypothetical protein Moror_12041 [Moniliophthora roreri MCA 2997]
MPEPSSETQQNDRLLLLTHTETLMDHEMADWEFPLTLWQLKDLLIVSMNLDLLKMIALKCELLDLEASNFSISREVQEGRILLSLSPLVQMALLSILLSSSREHTFSLTLAWATQKKGWTDGEIGIEWIQDFHEQTKENAAEYMQHLLVDSHNSHYTVGFLCFACAHCIHVLCYSAHGTHVYQGLNVVLFSLLKKCWAEEKHLDINKYNFLAVYEHAHLAALTPKSIKAAFAKTGVVPYNPVVITLAMMAPINRVVTSSRAKSLSDSFIIPTRSQ